MLNFTSDQWVILALILVLGLLIGAFLTSGGRRKWKNRYREEVSRREALERDHADRQREWDSREAEWRERDTLRAAALRDRDRDGIDDRREGRIDRDRDGIDDRREV